LNAPTRAQRARDDEETVVDRVWVATQHAFFGFRRSKMKRATMNTFTLLSFAAPGFRRMKMARATTSTMVVVAAAVVHLTSRQAVLSTRTRKFGPERALSDPRERLLARPEGGPFQRKPAQIARRTFAV